MNNYDFHKVKNKEDNIFGEHVCFYLVHLSFHIYFLSQSWTFHHSDFHADRQEALENIKRKVPASSKFLKIFGCTTDVAVDGIGCYEDKFDLVFIVNLFLFAMHVLS